MRPPVVSQAILEKAMAGDPEATAAIYQAFAPDLFRFFMVAVNHKELAEDLVAGVFVSVLESLPRFRGQADALAGWVFRIARHDLYDHRRWTARRRPAQLDDAEGLLDVADPAPGPQELAEAEMVRHRLRRALGALPTSQRSVLTLRLVAGLSTTETAAVLGRTLGAVKALQHRGLANLARQLGPVSEEVGSG
jgi:RNA polymerase sigma-70 factor (ECF subfamily)